MLSRETLSGGVADRVADKPISTILVIDDDPMVTAAIKRVLRGSLNVLTANDAEFGRELIISNPGIDLVLLDVTLPDYDSVEMLRDLRQSDFYPCLALMSGWHQGTLSSVAKLAESYGFPVVGAFAKPVNISALIARAQAFAAAR